MCGIVGMIGSEIGVDEKKMFRDLLVIDTIRGGDSTGYIGVDSSSVITPKKATDGWGFTNMTLFSKSLAGLKAPTALIGHNRWATKGAVTDGNAHPFVKDSTYLVHNGSLRGSTWTYGVDKLHDEQLTDVDSEAVCFNVAHEGLKNTVEKLDGAFVLVVYDYYTDIVSFVRNDERPLWFAQVEKKDVLLFASEPYMLCLAAEKHGVALAEEPWQLKTGVIMTFDLKEKEVLKSRAQEDVTLKEKWVYKAPAQMGQVWDYKTRTYIDKDKSGGQVGKSHGTTVKNGGTRLGSTEISTNVIPMQRDYKKKTLMDWGLQYKGSCFMVPESFAPFSGGYGAVRGKLYTMDFKEIEDGVMFKMKKPEYDAIRGDLISVYPESIHYPHGRSQQGIPCVAWGRQVSKKQAETYFTTYYRLKKIEEEEGTSMYSPVFLGEGGKAISRNRFKLLVKDGCGMCADPIPVSPRISQRVAWVYDGTPLCTDCTTLYGDQAKKANTTIEEQIEEALG